MDKSVVIDNKFQKRIIPAMVKKIDIENLISLTSAAKRRGVSRQFIESLVKRGKLNAVVIDGHPFVYAQDVDTYESESAGRPRKTETKKNREQK
jgi:deoxyhypusine synthase